MCKAVMPWVLVIGLGWNSSACSDRAVRPHVVNEAPAGSTGHAAAASAATEASPDVGAGRAGTAGATSPPSSTGRAGNSGGSASPAAVGGAGSSAASAGKPALDAPRPAGASAPAAGSAAPNTTDDAGAGTTPTAAPAPSTGEYTATLCPTESTKPLPAEAKTCDGTIRCGGPAHCIPTDRTDDTASNAPTCTGGRCVPDHLVGGSKLRMPSCTGVAGQGVCIPYCFAVQRNPASAVFPLGDGSCGTEEVCVPCINPLDNTDTGACDDACKDG